jgi:predicted transcriptional regulator
MTKLVITASPDTPLDEIARVMEQNAIKRIPIISDDGELVGIVSRANLVQALATAFSHVEVTVSDAAIRAKLQERLNDQPWAHTDLLTVTVHNGVVGLWGIAHSDTERKAIRALVEETPGVSAVIDYMAPRMPFSNTEMVGIRGATNAVVVDN